MKQILFRNLLGGALPAAAAPPAPDAAPTAPAGKGHEGHAVPGAKPALSADMAHEMGHGGKDLPAMVRDMRNRFWICLIFTVPIFVYAAMGGMFEPPAAPFGLEINLWLFFFASAAVLYPSWPSCIPSHGAANPYGSCGARPTC